jgi:hypothetical protein
MPRYSSKQIEQALHDCKGMVFVAGRRLGCSPNTIRARIEREPALREALEAERGMLLDLAELKLAQAIERGEPWAIALYLKTVGRDRGYVEKQEVQSLEPVKIIVEYSEIEPDSNTTMTMRELPDAGYPAPWRMN